MGGDPQPYTSYLSLLGRRELRPPPALYQNIYLAVYLRSRPICSQRVV